MTPEFPVPSRLPPAGRVLAGPVHALETRESLEGYIERLNRSAPAAERRIEGWGETGRDGIWTASVACTQPSAAASSLFMIESQCSPALSVLTRDASTAPAALSIILPLAGACGLRQRSGEYKAQAGGGLIIDPAEVEFVRVEMDTHYLEFDLPKSQLLRLGAELKPGAFGAVPRLAPVLSAELSQRMMYMSLQAARMLQPDADGLVRQGLFQRWVELMTLTLLDEHALAASSLPTASVGGALPASVRRALDYIDAHAHKDILLADIADAACVSLSSLLRAFKSRLDESPGAVLRRVRLDKAREELRRSDFASVREVARRWQFENASKFSQAYLRRFGELPSATRSPAKTAR